MSVTSVNIVLVILDRLEPLNTGESSRARGLAPGSADGSHYTCCSQVTCSRLCARPCSDYSRARGSAPLAHCHSSSGMRRCAHTPTLVRHHDMHHGSPFPATCIANQHPTRPRRQPIRSRTCTDFDMWTCLACTDFDRSARCGSAQLDTWLLICSLLSAPLSSLGSVPALLCLRLLAAPPLAHPRLLSAYGSAWPMWLCSA